MGADHSPLLDHPLASSSVFTPGDLMDAVQRERQLDATPVPPLCILDVDGDLADGLECGVVPPTIGGPYAGLIAAQLYAAGAHVVLDAVQSPVTSE